MATVKYIKAVLTEYGIAFPSNARKADLLAIVDSTLSEMEGVTMTNDTLWANVTVHEDTDITSDEYIDAIVADMQATLDQPTWDELNELSEEATTHPVADEVLANIIEVSTTVLEATEWYSNVLLDMAVLAIELAWSKRANVLLSVCYAIAAIYLLGTNTYHQLGKWLKASQPKRELLYGYWLAFMFIPMIQTIGSYSSTTEATWHHE